MNITDIKKSAKRHKKRIRVGRGMGCGLGKTSGRGHKGSKARSGYSRRLTYEGGQMPLFRRLPKVGFSNARWAVPVTTVNVEELNRFEAGSTVGVDELKKAGILKRPVVSLKVLAQGELKVALTVKAQAFSAAAADKIAKAGGKAEVIEA